MILIVESVKLFWIVLQCMIGYNLLMPVLFFLFFQIKRCWLWIVAQNSAQKSEQRFAQNNAPKIATDKHSTHTEADYAIIITAYEQTDTLHAVVASVLKADYANYIIYIVADKCDISHLHFDDERVVLLKPETVLSGNTRSHFYAINRFRRNHERLIILDSDNLISSNFIKELNGFFDKGFEAVQGYRAPKNLDTVYARLDAARDIYYHYYDGKLLFDIGSSATLSGSGMAFTVSLYRACLENNDVNGAGFDKVLQKEIVERGYRIAYAENALVYDEKTSQPVQLVQQRARWINTWFKYFSFGFGLMWKGIVQFDFNRFLFGLVLLRPPLFIFLILSMGFLLVNVMISPTTAFIWMLGFGLFIAGFLLSLIFGKADKSIYQALWGIPRFVFFQVSSLGKVRRANQHSVATKHYHTDKTTSGF